MTLRYLHSMIRVGDLKSALDFFCGKLGLVELSRKDFEDARFSLIFLAAPHDLESASSSSAPLLELTYNWDEKDYDNGRNFGHLAYQVDNIYETCERLQQKGVTINRPPHDGRMAFIKSPDGISVELLQKGDRLETQEPWASMKNTGTW